MTAKEYWTDLTKFQPLSEADFIEINLMQQYADYCLTEQAKPCECKGTNYGYGFAKCFDCGKLKEVVKKVIMLVVLLAFTSCAAPHYRYSTQRQLWVNRADSTDTYKGYAPNRVY